ncbi:MAG TPA: flagellar export chaperone FlgN [Methylomirabilota bacterium]|nr:flagellar export chaperone FlgN [Methylomirabilota bacterium]
MTESLPQLITALREELKHYGEMLALLDQQQESAMARLTEELLRSVTMIQAQAEAIQAARRHREAAQRAVARELAVAEASTFAEILPLLPADYRPLVQHLVEENNDLLQTVRQRARQNHLLLSRSVELMQRFLSALFPMHDPQVYTGRGTRPASPLAARPLYEAVG